MADAGFGGNPSGFIVGKIGEGTSATQALADWRDAGGTATTATWYRLWGEISNAEGLVNDIARLPGGVAVPVELHAPWSAGTEGRYAYQGYVQTERTEQLEGGGVLRVLESVPGMVVSDVILTPDEAAAQMIKDAAEGYSEGNYPVRALGATLTSAYLMTGVG